MIENIIEFLHEVPLQLLESILHVVGFKFLQPLDPGLEVPFFPKNVTKGFIIPILTMFDGVLNRTHYVILSVFPSRFPIPHGSLP